MQTLQIVNAMNSATLAQNLITELRVMLEQERAIIGTKMSKMHEQEKTQVGKHVEERWKHMNVQYSKGKQKSCEIILKLKEIKGLFKELPASNVAIIRPSFSTLCAEADIVMSKIIDYMKMHCDENQRLLSECCHELATAL